MNVFGLRKQIYTELEEKDIKKLYQLMACRRIVLLLMITGTLVFILISPLPVQLIGQKISMNVKRPLVLLIWDWPFGVALQLNDSVCLKSYGISNCILTDKKSMFGEADAVLFHHREIQGKVTQLPTKQERPMNQKWIWVSLESPSAVKNLEPLNGLFNWTLTYKQDSDIFMPYGELKPGRDSNISIPEKTHLVSWVVSNYNNNQLRAKVSAELSKYLNIDIYGKASNKLLSPEQLLPTISKYKFYLAFENCVHKDYITEKVWRNSFMAGAVPVVLGPSRANYEKYIPADSFIHIEDFISISELATYLQTLSRNEAQYQKYFQWRQTYTVKLYSDWRERFCTVCRKFNNLPQFKIYNDLKGWFNT
ncbi:alpha-(1,3)-fucosyltransferase 7 [Latimeria chalumnae]|uniref:Fucosyltransferase n=1 Tax=Latimeria chalumnae TaxID=7897 RepID=H3AVT3_LATCH|nr:PREDICTED: alpha-(1,3)-fucosyltransferase 7 [Latimeria chalumnae]|eukprot:XP_005994407.2 PREDICTED: alpha-(1,3)-fucosyltransferase 7 [Latimeria chalumnae]